jgi:dethiobiotin synthetase
LIMSKFFIAGTDTEVGKTFTTCALIEHANQLGLKTMGLKPLAAGCDLVDGELRNEDAVALQSTMNMSLSYAQINPVALNTPCSPHIAAAIDKRSVDAARVVGVCRGAILARPDVCFVEGAGGWRVPISARETMADIAKQLQFPVILVVGMRLGCINHALLTQEAIERDGLKIAGWVANSLCEGGMGYQEENIATLRSSINAPCLGVLPFARGQSPKDVCNNLDLKCLDL